MRPFWIALTTAAAALAPVRAGAALDVTAEPSKIVLGVDTRVLLRVRNVPSGAKLHAFVSQGALEPQPGQVPPGESDFAWTPPGAHVPASALVAFWTEGDMPDVATIALPLLGRTDVEAHTEPGASVTVELAGRQFGPVKADAKGHSAVPVEVPPNVRSAKVIAESGTQKTTRDVALDVPASDPMAVVFTAEPLLSRSKNWLIVMEAEPIATDALGIQFAGATSALRAGHAGWALYEVVPDGSPTGVDVRVTVKDRPEAHAEAHASVVEVPAAVVPPHVSRAWFAAVEVGGVYAGGSTGGIAGSLIVGYPLPIPRISSWVEVGGGFRSMGQTALQTDQGEINPSLAVVPVTLSLRVRALNRDLWSLHVRAGGGIEAFWLSTTSITAPPQSVAGSVPMGFAALQGAFAAGPMDLFIEVRGELAGGINSQFGNPLTAGLLLAGLRYVDR
jgi:hypothetical protein